MAEVLDIKNTELLEIYARLPLIDQPKESRVFLILGNEWTFNFSLDDCEYEAYLQLKNKNIDFHPFEIDYEVGFKNEEESLCWGTQKITNAIGGDLFWNINENDLVLPMDYEKGNILLFKLRFQFQIEPMLICMSNIEDKAVQTPPYIDSSFLLKSISKDFHKPLQDGFGHDVQLICGDQTIKAHKLVLCCRSTFFASKFENEDVDTNEVKIEDMDNSTFEQFFRYFYTGVLPELTSENAIRLYDAAVGYSVDALVKLCSSFLTENLSHENAEDILKIADRHKDSELKNDVMEYMTEENTLLMGEKWADFCKENPVLANEVLNLYVQQPRRKKPRLF